MQKIENHPLQPFLPRNAKLLMLGTFPPKRERWCMEFFYPNFQNDMWRIFGLVFFDNANYFVIEGQKRFNKPKIERFLRQKGIALSDTAAQVRRLKDNASDAFLRIVKPADLPAMLAKLPNCKAVAATGGKAAEALAELAGVETPPAGGHVEATAGGRKILIYRMVSSSRAYPKPLSQKAQIYADMFKSLGML